jgi:putative transcriptional regulator
MTEIDVSTTQDQVRTLLAAAYASGALDPGFRLLVDAQAELVASMADTLAIADVFVGAMLETETPIPMDTIALEKVFARIAGTPTSAPVAASAIGPEDGELARLPAIVRSLAENAERGSGWKFAGFGIRSLAFDAGSAATVELLRIEPGAVAPRHDHGGLELTLVLQGAFRDERGVYRCGDIAVASPGDKHRPIGEPGELCFALAVSEAPPRFTGALGLAQRLLQH